MTQGIHNLILFALGAGLLTVTEIQATSVLPVMLDTMTQASGVIVHGKVVAVQQRLHETLGVPITEITLQPEETLKGSETGLIHFRQVNGLGLPNYEVGSEILIFLHPNSKANVTSPVGGSQGMFKVVQTSSGKAAQNDFSPVISEANALASTNGSASHSLQLNSLKSSIRQAMRSRNKGTR